MKSILGGALFLLLSATACNRVAEDPKPLHDEHQLVIIGYQENYDANEDLVPVLQEIRNQVFSYWDSIALINKTIIIDTSGNMYPHSYIAEFSAEPYRDQHLQQDLTRFSVDLKNVSNGSKTNELKLSRNDQDFKKYATNQQFLNTFLQASYINQLVPIHQTIAQGEPNGDNITFAINSITFDSDSFTNEHKNILIRMINNSFITLEPQTVRYNKVQADRHGVYSMYTQIYPEDMPTSQMIELADHIFDFDVSYHPSENEIIVSYNIARMVEQDAGQNNSTDQKIVFSAEPFFSGDYYESNAKISQSLVTLIRFKVFTS